MQSVPKDKERQSKMMIGTMRVLLAMATSLTVVMVVNTVASCVAFSPVIRGNSLSSRTRNYQSAADGVQNVFGKDDWRWKRHGSANTFMLSSTFDRRSINCNDTSCGRHPHYSVRVCSVTSTLLQATNNNNNNHEIETETEVMKKSSTSSSKSKSTSSQIFSLAIPALASLAIDPLMTLADTAFVGQTATTPSALAGLGTASALLTFSFYPFNFLCTATAPLVSTRRSSGDSPGAASVGGQALTLSLSLGFLLSLLLCFASQPLLAAMGTSSTGTEANGYATQFLLVRALAAPAVLVSSAATGILRGYLDTRTALLVVAGANFVNLGLDCVLIGVLGMGPLGAGIATTTAEWICALWFLAILAGLLPSASSSDDDVVLLGSNQTLLQQSQSQSEKQSPSEKQSQPLVIAPALAMPPYQQIQPLLTASSSVFIRSLVLQTSLALAAAMAAKTTSSPSASVAAHQIALQLWLLCSFLCDALAAASQALVADAIGRSDSDDVRILSRTVFGYGALLGFSLGGILQAGIVSGRLVSFFTHDHDTIRALLPLLHIIVLAQPLNSFVFCADGVLQGASEFTYQAKTMVMSVAAAIASFVTLQVLSGTAATTATASLDSISAAAAAATAVVGNDANPLLNVWYSLIVLQLARGLTSLWKLVQSDGPIDLLGRDSKNDKWLP